MYVSASSTFFCAPDLLGDAFGVVIISMWESGEWGGEMMKGKKGTQSETKEKGFFSVAERKKGRMCVGMNLV